MLIFFYFYICIIIIIILLKKSLVYSTTIGRTESVKHIVVKYMKPRCYIENKKLVVNSRLYSQTCIR